MKKYIIFLFFVILFACSENTGEPVLKTVKDDAALIIVVETKFLLNPFTELAFIWYKDAVLNVLVDIFGVNKSKMENLSLSEIIEIYGEEWQIREMKKTAKRYYKEVIVLTDEEATGNNLMQSIAELAEKGYYIDMIFSLHASSEKEICFIDRNYHIDEITKFLKENKYYIRSLYQTCCYGSYFFEDWENAGMIAVNGSVLSNGVNIFSPVYFLQEWVSGKNFSGAVQRAYERDIEKVRSYNDQLPVEDFLLDEQTLKDSRQLTGGINSSIFWIDFPIDYSNKNLIGLN